MDEIDDKTAQEEAEKKIRLALIEVLGAADAHIEAKKELGRTKRKGSSTVDMISAAQDDEETTYYALKATVTKAKAAMLGPVPAGLEDNGEG